MAYKTVAATELKNRLGDYLGYVIHRREPLLVERHGRPAAVLVEYGEWRRDHQEEPAQEETQDPWTLSYRQFLEKMKKNHPHAKSFSAVELVRKIREEGG